VPPTQRVAIATVGQDGSKERSSHAASANSPEASSPSLPRNAIGPARTGRLYCARVGDESHPAESPTQEELLTAIDRLAETNRRAFDANVEKTLRELRYRAFLMRRGEPLGDRSAPPPLAFDLGEGLPTVSSANVTSDVVRAAIEQHGSLIVRGLLDRSEASELRSVTDSALAARQNVGRNRQATPSPWYDETTWASKDVRRSLAPTGMMQASGMMAADSPRGLFLLLEIFREQGIADLAEGVLGVRPAISVEKSLFRRVHPQKMPSWHQDGAFLGAHVRTLDVWIALSPCGRTAPGLDVFPHRVDRILPTGCFFSWDLAYDTLSKAYPGIRPVTPEFDAGDAILFDHLCAHRTGAGPDMTEPRYAVECWLFAPSAFPSRYSGLVL
jgi:hypothetical protein